MKWRSCVVPLSIFAIVAQPLDQYYVFWETSPENSGEKLNDEFAISWNKRRFSNERRQSGCTEGLQIGLEIFYQLTLSEESVVK